MLWRSAPGVLVLGALDGTTLSVHGPGSEVWDLLAQPRSIEQLATTLAERYGAPLHVVTADVTALARRLADAGYVTTDG